MGSLLRASFKPLARTGVFSFVTSLLALLAAKLPGLVPHLLGASAKPAATATISALKAAPRTLHPKATPGFLMKVGAVFSAGLMVAGALQLSQDSGLSSRSQALRSPLNTGSGNNSSTIYFPYAVDPSLFSPPENLTLPGNLTDPQLADTTLGAQPMFFLLAVETDGSNSSLVIFTGSYSPSAAREAVPCHENENGHAKDCKDASDGTGDTAIVPGDNCGGGNGRGSQPQDNQNCTQCTPSNEGGNDISVQGSHTQLAKNRPGKPPACPPMPSSQPLVWSLPHTIVTYPFPILGDGLANDGSTLVASASLPTGSTELFVSRDASLTWRFLTSVVGAGAGVAVGNDTAVLATLRASTLTMTTTQMNTNLSRSAILGPAQNASPVVFADGTVGVVASNPNGTIEYFASSDGGATFAYHLVGGYAATSTSDLFNTIGSTSLSVPGGVPGQVSAAVESDQVFALYTSSVNGRVEAFTTSSGDNGTTWLGPYSTSAGNGAIMDPQVKVSPVGYAYATWRENSGGAWRADQAVFRMDGRPLQPPSPLPLDAWEAGSSIQAPTLALDDLERPLYVWDTTGFLGSVLQFTSGYLSPAAALATLTQGVKQLAPGDFATPANNSTDKVYLLGLLTEIGQNLTATTHLTPGHRMNALRILETELYPSVTSIPLVLLCTLANVSCSIGPGDHGREHEKNVPEAATPLPSDGGMEDNESEDNETGAAPSTANVTHLIVNLTGAFVANKYLAIYADWLIEALGVGVLAPKPSDPTLSSNGDSLSVSPVMWNPSVTALDISFSLTGSQTRKDRTVTTNGTLCYYSDLTTSSLNSQNTSVAVTSPNGTSHTAIFNSTTILGGVLGGSETVYLTHLDPGISYTWSVTVTGQLQYEVYESYHCPSTHSGGSIYGGTSPGPFVSIGPVTDNAQFKLTDSPKPPVVQAVTSVKGDVPSLHWNSSARGQATASIQKGSSAPLTPLNPSDSYLMEHDFVFPTAATGTYVASIGVLSVPGDSSVKGLTLSAGGPSTSPAVSDNFTFTFTLDPSAVVVSMLSVSDVTSTSAQLTWWTYPRQLPSATLTYTEEASPSSGSETVFPLGCSLFGGTAGCKFTAEVEGLSPLSRYVADASVREVISGVTYQGIDTVSFFTSGTFGLSTMDLPYDSISKEGGGENVQWSDLQVVGGPGASFLNGSVSYSPVSQPGQVTTMPLESLMSVPNAPSEHQFNLTAGLVLDTTYNLQMTLNYSVSGTPLQLVSEPSTFTYLKDSSGDGLTDAEKSHGWYVSYTDAGGGGHRVRATAIPSDYATNFLVSDYVEKEFGLNPGTADTSGSHMLDTWNLTFDVGPVGTALPTPGWQFGFHYWYENSTDPFGSSGPIGNGWGNLTYNAGFGPTQVAGDNHPWTSRVLWSTQALSDFELLMEVAQVGWLRAVTGSHGGELTLTVWGKLSWGANPLAASTPGDGIADGARLDPLYEVDLQIGTNGHGSGFSAGLNDCSGDLSTGDGFAVRVYVNASGSTEFVGDMSQGLVDCSMSLGSPPSTLTLPLPNTVQFQSVSFNVLANTATCQPGQSGCSNPYQLEQLALSGCSPVYSVSVDMLNPNTPSDQFVHSQGGSSCPEPASDIYGGITTVPAGVKAPTYLWVPDDNSTLSNLPTGLQRYVGEQDFVLVVANLSSPPGTCGTCSTSTVSVPNPWGNGQDHYSIALQQSSDGQLVNFLIPRAQFFNSPMGQAVLNDTAYPYLANAPATVPMAGISMAQLACYWQSHAVAPNWYSVSGVSSTGPDLCKNVGTGNGFAATDGIVPGTPYSLTTLADQENCLGSNPSPNCGAGGVPSNPSIESSTPSPSIQAVITLNLSVYDPTSANLSYLLAGLLDNSTGGVNGTLKDVTYELPSLGLNSVVMGTLANSIAKNTGVFGYPISEASPSQPPSCTWGCSLWNAVSGVVTTVISGVLEVAGAVWSATVAAFTYLNDLVPGLRSLEEQAAAALVSALKAVANTLEAALQALIAFVEKEVTALIDAVVSPIRTAVNNYFSSVNQDFDSMYTAVGNGQPVTTSLAKPFWQDMALPLLLMTAIAVAAETALVIVNGLSLGAGFFVGILVTVIVGTVLTLLAPTSGLISEMLAGGSAAILAMMQFLNDTASSLHKGPLVAHPQSGGLCGYYQSFHTLADAFAVLDDILGSASGIVLSLLLFSINAIVGVKSLTLLASSAILSLTILAFFFDAASLLNSGEKALAFADIGFISGLVAIMISKVSPAIEDIPIFGEFDTVIKYMDYAATGMGGAEAIVDTLNYCPGT